MAGQGLMTGWNEGHSARHHSQGQPDRVSALAPPRGAPDLAMTVKFHEVRQGARIILNSKEDPPP